MSSSRSLESGLFAAFWDDGLLDLLFGCAVLTAGLGWIGLGPLAVIQMPIWVVLWSPLRRAYVEPYAGYVRFSQTRQRHTTQHLALTLALGIGALGLVALAALKLANVGSSDGAASLPWVAGLPALLLAVAAALGSLLTNARRFFFYALLFLLCALIIVMTQLDPALSLIAAGTGVLVSGGLRFRTFHRDSRAFADTADS